MRCEQCGKETVNNTRCSHDAMQDISDPFSTLGDLVSGATDEKKSDVIDNSSISTTHKNYFSELGDIIVRRKPGKRKDIHYSVNAENYPWFERSEFVSTQLRKEPYVIERLPEIGATPSINWVQVLSAPVAMLMIAFILMAAGMSNMLMMLPMQLVGVVTAVISYYSQKKKYNKNSNDREIKYKNYLAEAETDLEEIAQNQKKTM